MTWLQSFNPFMIFAFTPLVVGLWAWQAQAKAQEPYVVPRWRSVACCAGSSYLFMAGAAYMTGPHGHASWLWLFLFFAIYHRWRTLSLADRAGARRARRAGADPFDDDGLWFITSFTGNLLAGYIGSFCSQMDKTHFFLLLRRDRGVRRSRHVAVRSAAEADPAKNGMPRSLRSRGPDARRLKATAIASARDDIARRMMTND